MKKWIACCLLISMLQLQLTAQTYQPNWESLDSRPVPSWFMNEKFGIFIHWGAYSVPSWGPQHSYSEWYQNGLQADKDNVRKKFHKLHYGDMSYYGFGPMFKADRFDPDAWAKVFEQSGAKYIVLTSKHHDGFAMWPSKEADKIWGFPWNSVTSGPKRDLLGDLFKAVRKTSVRAGMYYSLYEWYNPLYKSDINKYVSDHMWPQMKDLINTYQPDVFWTDGDWDVSDAKWKSPEFLAWLYNESPVKEKIVTYDRWGSGIRFHHGGVYTPEYQPDLDFEDHPWEESRGMGYSYGYNKEEDIWDYNSAQSLVLALVDKVSRGGNFLLDIGPDDHGKIPPIMQERLLQIGAWLQENGEAIYNTRRWIRTSQASANDSKEKDLYFTYNPTSNALYAIAPTFNNNGEYIIKDMDLPAGTNISFVATKEKCAWKKQGNDIVVTMPSYRPAMIKAPYAYAIKIENFGAFAAKPKIEITYPNGAQTPTVALIAPAGAAIHYTTDGTNPTLSSPTYTSAFTTTKTTLVKAQIFDDKKLPGKVAQATAKAYTWMPAVKVSGALQPGVAYSYFETKGKQNLATLPGLTPTITGITQDISVAVKKRESEFSLLFDGYLKIEKDGIYHFTTRSDDGSILYIDDEEVVNNDGDHGSVEAAGKAALKKGYHKIRVAYYDGSGGNELTATMQLENAPKNTLNSKLIWTKK
jgi:alpha-L-fucosidase